MNIKEYLETTQLPKNNRLTKFDRDTERFIKQLGYTVEEIKTIELLNTDGIDLLKDPNKKAFTPDEVLKYKALMRQMLFYEIKRIVDLKIQYTDKKHKLIEGEGRMPLYVNLDGQYEFHFIKVKLKIELE